MISLTYPCWTSPFHHRLPPGRLPIKILHLWNRADHQRPLLIGHQDPDIVRFPDIVPPDEVVGDDAIDEEGKLALLDPADATAAASP